MPHQSHTDQSNTFQSNKDVFESAEGIGNPKSEQEEYEELAL
jgi:hypothetical protein